MQDIPAVDFERDAVKRPDHGNVQSWGKVVNICCALVLEDLFSATEARSRRLNNKHYIDSKANIHITTKFDRPQEPNHKAGSASWCNPCIKFNMLKEHGDATERKKGKKEIFLHFHILWGIRATAKKKANKRYNFNRARERSRHRWSDRPTWRCRDEQGRWRWW